MKCLYYSMMQSRIKSSNVFPIKIFDPKFNWSWHQRSFWRSELGWDCHSCPSRVCLGRMCGRSSGWCNGCIGHQLEAELEQWWDQGHCCRMGRRRGFCRGLVRWLQQLWASGSNRRFQSPGGTAQFQSDHNGQLEILRPWWQPVLKTRELAPGSCSKRVSIWELTAPDW